MCSRVWRSPPTPRRFRQASPLPQVRKSERARNPQTSTAANIDKTISQPLIVAVMTDLLEPKPDDVVLEIGTGLGYQSAVLAELVTRVYSVIDELAQRAKQRLKQQGYTNVDPRPVVTGRLLIRADELSPARGPALLAATLMPW